MGGACCSIEATRAVPLTVNFKGQTIRFERAPPSLMHISNELLKRFGLYTDEFEIYGATNEAIRNEGDYSQEV